MHVPFSLRSYSQRTKTEGVEKNMLILKLWKPIHRLVNPGDFTGGSCTINRSKDKCLSAHTFCSRNTMKDIAVLLLSLSPSEAVRMERRSRKAMVLHPQNAAISSNNKIKLQCNFLNKSITSVIVLL